MRKKTKTESRVSISLFLDQDFAERLDAIVAEIREVNPASALTRSDFIRQAISDLIDEVQDSLDDAREIEAVEAGLPPPVRERTRPAALAAFE